MRRFALIVLAACHSDVRETTHAFVATEPCGQGPYEVHFKADGKMGSEGVEVFACTAHRIAGHVEVSAAGIAMRDVAFGEGADNARCMAGGPIVATSSGGAGASGSGAIGGPGARGATPVLVEQPALDNGGLIPDDACKPYGLPGEYLMNLTMTSTEVLTPGADLTVKIWSDAPNDLQNVVFLVRHAISTHTRAEEQKEEAQYEKEHAHDPPPPPRPPAPKPDHGAPPPPLAEERPAQPAGAVWIAGYWTWTGAQWGWTSGFWRTDLATPAPRLEVPGEPPSPTSIWVAGAWQLRAGAWIWIGGRWRR